MHGVHYLYRGYNAITGKILPKEEELESCETGQVKIYALRETPGYSMQDKAHVGRQVAGVGKDELHRVPTWTTDPPEVPGAAAAGPTSWMTQQHPTPPERVQRATHRPGTRPQRRF